MYNRATKKVVIDAGHGGNDPGAISGNLKEKDLNLEAAQYMYKRLQELGIPATIVRNKDETLDRNERVSRILNAYGNSPDVILISNHINAGGGEGAEIVYALRNTPELAQMALDNIGDAGQLKRKVYQRRLPENPNRDYYFIIRDTGNLESLLVEYGFIDNANDAYKLQNNLNDYVEGVVKAIADYAQVPYSNIETAENYYIVQKGDTLYGIANKFDISVTDLKTLNNLTNNTLKIGQKLLISKETSPSQELSTYIVEKGDTLYGIANKFQTTVDELKTLNNITTNTLLPGQQIIVPNSTIIPDEEEPMTPEEEQPYIIYTVQKGDSLWKISQKYGIPVNEIINFNNLSTINLKIDDEIKIPINNIEETTYTVKSGDTLWSIAKKYNTTVDKIKSANYLTTNLLTLGQTLVIPQ